MRLQSEPVPKNQFLEEMDSQRSPLSRPLDTALHVLGISFATVLVLKILLVTSRLFGIYFWPKMFPQRDYVAKYGKWAVITGGSDGIGKGFAMGLAQRGMNIFIFSNRENDVVSEIKNKFPSADVRYSDVDFSSPDVYERIEKELSEIDDIGILVNNVGMVQPKWQALAQQKRSFLKTIMNVNMTAMVCMTEIVLTDMLKRNKGLIVNVSSLSSILPLPYAAMYSASKAFVDNYSVCLAAELNNTQIGVKCIRPNFIKTGLLKDMSQLTNFLDEHFWLRWTFPDVGEFAESATATLGESTPVMYGGYWPHDLLEALIPHSSLGKERITTWNKAITRWLTGDV